MELPRTYYTLNSTEKRKEKNRSKKTVLRESQGCRPREGKTSDPTASDTRRSTDPTKVGFFNTRCTRTFWFSTRGRKGPSPCVVPGYDGKPGTSDH